MQKFWWPGYEMQLVRELQRQQNSSQFCDTLLQTEGISVPTHSCVLAALSPYLCQRLSASPSPPSGQKRRLQLQALTSQTLLKLVGLLYSGELEVRGSEEQNDVLAAAHQLGIGHLVLGGKDGWVKGGDLLNRRLSVGKPTENGSRAEETRQRSGGPKTQDEQGQAEMNGRREKKRSFVSVATQTVKAGASSESGSAPAQTPECPSSIPPNITPSEQPITFSKLTVRRPSVSEMNTTSTSTLSASFSDDPSSPRFLEENISKPPPDTGDVTSALDGDRTRREGRRADGPTTEDGGNGGELRDVCRDDRTPEGKRPRGGINLENMKRMENTQMSVKMKLKRTTERKAWRVVSAQDEDETPSLLPSENQGSHPQMDQTSAPSVLPVQDSDTPNLPPVSATSPQAPKHGSKNSELQAEVDLDHGRLLEPPQGSVEDPEPDIDRILDEIMMGLNILPSLNDDCQTAETSHGGEQNFCQVLENPSADAEKFYDSVAEDPHTTGSILPLTGVLKEPKLHFPRLQPPSSQEDGSLLHFLPLSREDDPQPDPMFPLSCLDKLRLPRPLSPLDPCSPEAQRTHPNESFILPENHVQQSFHRPPWFTGTPWSLHFPLDAPTGDNCNSLPQGSDSSCGSEQLCVGWKPNNQDTSAETDGGAEDGGNKSQPEEKSDPEKWKKRKRVATGDAAAPKRRRRCRNVTQDPLCQCLEFKRPTSCSVSLSSSDVLNVERKTTDHPSNSSLLSLDQRKRASVEENTRMGGNGEPHSQIRTRSFMKRSQEKRSEKIPKKSVLIPVVGKAEAKEKLDVVVPKRGRGRPRKINLDPLSRDRTSSEASEQQASPKPRGRGRKRRRKARRNPSRAEKTESNESAGENAAAAAANNPATRKHSLVSTLKRFQKFIKRQKKESTENQRDEPVEEKRDAENGWNGEAEVEIKESLEIQDPDETPNDSLTSAAAQVNKSNNDDSNGSSGQKTSSDENNLPSDDVVDGMKPSCDPQPLLKDEGASCWTRGSEAGLSVISDNASHLDTKLPQTTVQVLSHRTDPPSSGANGLSVTPPRDPEEDNEEEVEVLLVSPGNSLPEVHEENKKKIETSSSDEDKDEEEDVNEIDVTGDEEE